jgi:cellulose synthase/poly-beta-1,6-N-acetylglucosamine synthase-like glycosyltransferase
MPGTVAAHAVAGGVLFSLGIVPLLACGYLALLAAASTVQGRRRPAHSPRRRVAVLVPAHDEELLVARCVDSLLAQSYPRELLRVIVVADNCGDATAALAAAAGAEVMERVDPKHRGKGHALRWAIDRLLASASPPDAIAVVDADSVADPELVLELDARLEEGDAVQGEYLVLADPGSLRSELVGLAFLLFHRVRLSGRARLGLPAALVGNGMLFASSLLRRHPWSAFSGVEDLEYTLQLRLQRVRPVFAPHARLFGPVPTGRRTAVRQRQRWEGGRQRALRPPRRPVRPCGAAPGAAPVPGRSRVRRSGRAGAGRTCTGLGHGELDCGGAPARRLRTGRRAGGRSPGLELRRPPHGAGLPSDESDRLPSGREGLRPDALGAD